MKRKFTLEKYFALLSALLIILAGCSTFQKYDDAVRIKPDSSKNYNKYPFELPENVNRDRNGSALRGTVIKIQSILILKNCDSIDLKDTSQFYSKSYLVFLDSLAKSDEEYVEYIPLEAVDLIGPKMDSSINLIERYNYPLDPRQIRKVPLDTIILDTCIDCECVPFKIGLPSYTIGFVCPTRECHWYFVEARLGYAAYLDKQSPTKEQGREAYLAELAAGVRFGVNREWGIGLAVSSGIKTFNSIMNTDVKRPFAMLHLRYDFLKKCIKPEEYISSAKSTADTCAECEYQRRLEEFKRSRGHTTSCISPFVYGQIGMAFDNLTMNLYRLNINTGCKDKISAALPYLDVSMPISYTLGIGVDIPMSSFMDLSLDMGFRSLAFGESSVNLGFTNVPSLRRVNMFLFRLGITL